MVITDAQFGFYHTIKNYHRAGYSGKYILTKIVSYIDGEVVSNLKKGDENSSADYTIYLDSCPLFTGTYTQLLDDLFEYIFDTHHE